MVSLKTRQAISPAAMVAPDDAAVGHQAEPPQAAALAMLRQRLFRHARFAVGNDALAEDLVQETLIAVVGRLPQYRGDATLLTWAVAILKNKVADWYRSPMHARTTHIDPIDSEQGGELACNPTHVADGGLIGAAPSSQEPANLVQSREMMQALRLCVGAMPLRTAQAFLMHDWHGYQTAEICDQLEVSADNVRQMLFRARRVLRECMTHDWAECKGRRALNERVDLTEHKRWPPQRHLTPYLSTEID